MSEQLGTVCPPSGLVRCISIHACGNLHCYGVEIWLAGRIMISSGFWYLVACGLWTVLELATRAKILVGFTLRADLILLV